MDAGADVRASLDHYNSQAMDIISKTVRRDENLGYARIGLKGTISSLFSRIIQNKYDEYPSSASASEYAHDMFSRALHCVMLRPAIFSIVCILLDLSVVDDIHVSRAYVYSVDMTNEDCDSRTRLSTPLFCACRSRRFDVAGEILRGSKVDDECTNFVKAPPRLDLDVERKLLWQACADGDVETVEFVLKKGGRHFRVNYTFEDVGHGESLFQLAGRKGHADMVRTILHFS